MVKTHKWQSLLDSTEEKMIQTQAGFEPTTPMDHINHKKILVVRGIEPQISGWESKTLPLSYGGLLHKMH